MRAVYVAFPRDCRCIAAVCVDEPDHPRDVAKFLGQQARSGFAVERMSIESFRELPFRCEAHPGDKWKDHRPVAGPPTPKQAARQARLGL